MILVTPIELLQIFVVRPFTLAVRLFANMFAGHMLLVMFSLGTVYLLTVGNFSVVFGPFAFLMAIVMTFFELLVIVLQAYVFTVLTATYLNGPSRPRTDRSAPRQPPGTSRATDTGGTPRNVDVLAEVDRQHRFGRLRPRRHRPRHRCRHRVGRLHPGHRPAARVGRPDPDLRLPRLRPLRGAGPHRLRRRPSSSA